jgi:Na+/H+-translocating membrane pyrophosphatase
VQFFGDDWQSLFEAITGYGLGGSSIALFGRVGGGIYTKVKIHERLQRGCAQS